MSSKLSLKVSCDKLKPGEKNLSSAFDDSNAHEIKCPYSPVVGGKVVCHCQIPLNLSIKQELVYALRKLSLKNLIKSRILSQ